MSKELIGACCMEYAEAPLVQGRVSKALDRSCWSGWCGLEFVFREVVLGILKSGPNFSSEL
jgi:hypothetical protein